jgi:hypothetical protein
MKIIAAIIFAVVGVAGAAKLIFADTPSSPAALITISSLSFCCLLILVFADQIDWFDLKNLKVKLRRVEEARAEVERREKKVADIARILSEVGDWNIENHGLLFGTDVIEKNKKWLRQKNAELKAVIDEKK